MTHSYNNQMATSVHPRLENLLASLSLNLAEESQTALERASGLSGSATARCSPSRSSSAMPTWAGSPTLLGLTHSGAVRLVSQLERAGLAERRSGADRRRVEVRLTPAGRRRAREARAARDEWCSRRPAASPATRRRCSRGCWTSWSQARVASRIERRKAGESGAWWCRTCDFAACGRPEGRCPAQVTADRAFSP